ncbi:diguanylate cyclase [Pseudomonas putida]|nr:diguanylate cyclase [Pseudomonas putida]
MCVTLSGAGMPANTGEARARHRVVFFAGAPAPTGARVPSQACG